MKFSVIIPLYNKENCIKKTIQSVLDQTYPDFELIIVNDGSTDNSLKVAQSIVDSRIRIIDKLNGGVSSARNVGMEEARYDWITFLDADDIMYPYALSTYKLLHEQFPNSRVLIAATDSSKRIYTSTGRSFIVTNYYKENIKSNLKYSAYLLCSDCICINKECHRTIGGFNLHYKHGEDLEYWYRLSMKYSFAKIEKSISFYDLGAENRSTDTVSNVENTWNMYKEVFNNRVSIKDPIYVKLIFGDLYYNQLFGKTQPLERISFFAQHGLLIILYVLCKCFYKLMVRNSVKNE